MAFLFAPDKAAYKDETLESYILRIAKENFFDAYVAKSILRQYIRFITR